VILLRMRVCVQSSSLWASLLTLPLSVTLILSLVSEKTSGVLSLLFIIVFIGGLLVLLVRVASSVHQEQGIPFRVLLFRFGSILLRIRFCEESAYEWNISFMRVFSWCLKIEEAYFFIRILYLLVGLAILSTLFGEFKGTIRRL